jgi:hypothetical protein
MKVLSMGVPLKVIHGSAWSLTLDIHTHSHTPSHILNWHPDQSLPPDADGQLFSGVREVRQRLGYGDASVALGACTHAVGEDSLASASQLGRIVWSKSLEILNADGRKLKTA